MRSRVAGFPRPFISPGTAWPVREGMSSPYHAEGGGEYTLTVERQDDLAFSPHRERIRGWVFPTPP